MAIQDSIVTCVLRFYGPHNQATRLYSLEKDTPGYSDNDYHGYDGYDGALERAYCLVTETLLIMRTVNMRNPIVQSGIFGS
ncbi:hypothetical protein BOTCAL_0846g00020 [Botryotinia calthae]|uniref:Uncharacterized protein n=1 Tax=Botryotinia calthae TaxID=38488 RepID=A0A4Y8CHZ2_9HELO|nr:hypothetical protein BOTCAL_0846g00020 [Botryotinia calthae]